MTPLSLPMDAGPFGPLAELLAELPADLALAEAVTRLSDRPDPMPGAGWS